MKHLPKMNVYLSNLALLNVKLHNLHWNVQGLHFLELHAYTQGLYEDLFKKFDDIAELIKTKDQKPLVTMADYLQHGTLKEESKNVFTATEVVDILKADLTLMRDLAKEVRLIADEVDDFETVNMFEEHVDDYSKALWFVQAMLS